MTPLFVDDACGSCLVVRAQQMFGLWVHAKSSAWQGGSKCGAVVAKEQRPCRSATRSPCLSLDARRRAQVMGAGVTLLSEVEAPGSGASADDAAVFLKQHTQTHTTQVARPLPTIRVPWLLQDGSVLACMAVCRDLRDAE